MHTKRSQMPKSWPVPRKTKTKRFVAMPNHAKGSSLNLLVILRDILKFAKTRKEAKHILHNGDVKVNGKTRRAEEFPVQILDTVSLEKINKYYRLEIVNRKFSLVEIKKSEVETKIVKIIGKITLEKNKIQMNLADGTNMLSKVKFNLGDSAVLNTAKNTVEKVLPLKQKAKVEIIAGKHAGEKGEIVEIIQLSREKVYKIKLEKGEVSLPFKTVLVIG